MAKLRVLLIGCGDVALRAARLLSPKFRLYGLTRHPEQHARLRAAGITPIAGDLDRRSSLSRLALSPFAVLHCAPPAAEGDDDTRTRNLIAALASARSLPRRFAYIGTSGVYGDCAGALVAETRALHPESARARRRVAAERRLRRWARGSVAARGPSSAISPSARRRDAPGTRTTPALRIAILRAPGIYAADRLPLERLRAGTSALRAADDVHTNHVHADDLAHAAVLSLFFGKPQRAYNVNDDSELKMGEWFDLVADRTQLPRPRRVSRAEAEASLPPSLLSFMRESRRLVNARAKQDLRWRPRYPQPDALLAALARERDAA